jgi:hypothetical protein
MAVYHAPIAQGMRVRHEPGRKEIRELGAAALLGIRYLPLLKSLHLLVERAVLHHALEYLPAEYGIELGIGVEVFEFLHEPYSTNRFVRVQSPY